MRRWLVVGFIATVTVEALAGQVTTSASTGVVGSPRSGAPMGWRLGGSLGLARATWGTRLSAAAGPERRQWRVELAGEAWWGHAVTDRVTVFGVAAGAVERPIGWIQRVDEQAGRLGLGVQTGPVRWQVGGAALHSSLGGNAAGAFAGGTLRLGPVEVTGAVSELRPFGDARFAGRVVPGVADTGQVGLLTRLAHGTLSGTWRRERYAITGRLIRRTSFSQIGRFGWQIEVAAEAFTGARLQGSVGRVPLAGAWFLPVRPQLQLGMALVARRPRRERAPAGETSFQVWRTSDSRITMVIAAPGAKRVEIAGDFSDWEPMPARPETNGTFTVDLSLAPGTYRINLRHDGGVWRVPPGLAGADDGFGGQAGVLVVP